MIIINNLSSNDSTQTSIAPVASSLAVYLVRRRRRQLKGFCLLPTRNKTANTRLPYTLLARGNLACPAPPPPAYTHTPGPPTPKSLLTRSPHPSPRQISLPIRGNEPSPKTPLESTLHQTAPSRSNPPLPPGTQGVRATNQGTAAVLVTSARVRAESSKLLLACFLLTSSSSLASWP